MSRGDVRSVKRTTSKSDKPQSARLVVRRIVFSEPKTWFRDAKNFAPLVKALETCTPATSIAVKPLGGRRFTVDNWADLAEFLQGSKKDVYEIESEAFDVTLHFNFQVTDISLIVECEFPVNDGPIDSVRKTLGELLEEIHRGYCGHAGVGPSLSITLRNVPYTRPRPPHDNPHWPPGAVTLAACQRFYDSEVDGGAVLFKKLKTSPVPPGLVRRHVDDLLVIETEATDLDKIGEQRMLLEKWIGETLQLPLDEDFDERGDMRITIWQREKIGKLGFYDPMAKVVYKSAPELQNDDLDPGTLRLIEQVLNLEKLPDARNVTGKRIVFVGRPAAVRWRPWVSERGGEVAYLGEDGELWEPAPEA